MNYTEVFNLSGRVAIVTGGHSWIGYDMAAAMAGAGCNIIIASRNLEKSQKACDEIQSTCNVDTLAVAFDQCNYDSVERMADIAYGWKKHIDILINNAGGGSGAAEGDFLKRDPALMSDMIHSNLLGPMFCSRAVGIHMVKRQRGKIINLGSVAGVCGRDRKHYRKHYVNEQPVDYAAAKAGVIGMTRDLAAYYAEYGIQVNCISPGGFDKGALPEGFVRDYSNKTMAGRMGTFGNDLYGAALFLSSSASDYVTGQNLIVDGGFTVLK